MSPAGNKLLWGGDCTSRYSAHILELLSHEFDNCLLRKQLWELSRLRAALDIDTVCYFYYSLR